MQAADSIGNVRLRVQQKAAAAAAEEGARSSKAAVGRRGKLRVQARAPLFALTAADCRVTRPSLACGTDALEQQIGCIDVSGSSVLPLVVVHSG